MFTISDSRSAGAAEERGGPAVVEKLPPCEAAVHREIVPDDAERVRAAVQAARNPPRGWNDRCPGISRESDPDAGV